MDNHENSNSSLSKDDDNETSNNSPLNDDTNPKKRRKLNPMDSKGIESQNGTISNSAMDQKAKEMDNKKGDIDLSSIKDVDQLKKFGFDTLKKELQIYGLKCGGTLEQRAERLFLL
eukprot:CAMPEP_0201577758 /NCGR_PEP_ID=MMETSP0190_2-20130828/24266_1 /ASSEMBLY_ACC=CAM_ASM_000263 /TAXON_ID=37353 /ORGANISM="Rosalina sp." /LENGTH=115 /DNA_ID=CAMNT_0048010117 /DNA_START=112 /DNA_END=455 /DNA_ORIENTATION=-